MLRPLPLRRYLSALQACGFTAADVLHGTAIRPESLDDPRYLIELEDYLQVIANAIRLRGDDGLGLEMGLARDVGDFRVLGHAALTCRTVRQSMEDYWCRYGDALGMLAKITFRGGRHRGGRGDMNAGRIEAAQMTPAIYRFLVEEALGLVLKVGEQVSGTRPHFESIALSYPRPDYGARYEALFRCPVRFGARDTQVVLDDGWLDGPLPGSDDEVRGALERNLDQLKREIEASSATSAQLKQLFLRAGTRLPALEQAAEQLGLSPRTLRRRLQDEGSSFSRLLEAHRKAQALQALEREDATTKRLSERAGFEDVNAFRRAFKKWTGQTVRGYRGH